MVPFQFLALLKSAKRRMLYAQSELAHTHTCAHTRTRECTHAYTYIYISKPSTVASMWSLPAYRCRMDAVGNCTERMTSCSACYFAGEERPLPSQCSTNLEKYRCAGLTGRKRNKCLKRWGTCVRKAFKDIHGKVWGSAEMRF